MALYPDPEIVDCLLKKKSLAFGLLIGTGFPDRIGGV